VTGQEGRSSSRQEKSNALMRGAIAVSEREDDIDAAATAHMR